MDVAPNSPAAISGLESDTDYVIGSRAGQLHEKEDFGALVTMYEHKQLPLWVYNVDMDVIRGILFTLILKTLFVGILFTLILKTLFVEVVIVPDSQWGGDGMIGCDIGYGIYVDMTLLMYQ